MSYGSPGWREWVKGPTESIALLKAAFDAGINTWDTANMYSNGESERVVGMALRQHNIPRSQVVIMTKAYFPVNEDDVGLLTNRPEVALLPRFVNRCGLSRVALFDAVDASLARLQTSYIDVLQIHRLDDTPFVEVMKALNDLVESGKVRYIGASSMWAHEFVQMQAIADARGWTKFISMQNEYNLLYREEGQCPSGIGKESFAYWPPRTRGNPLLQEDWRWTHSMEPPGGWWVMPSCLSAAGDNHLRGTECR
jgi:aryl-alcohol dehydrogenase-like predicted oxidoreductase